MITKGRIKFRMENHNEGVWSVPEELSESKRHMRLTPYILARVGENFETLILETVRGEQTFDMTQLDEIIAKLQRIRETIDHLKVSRKIALLGLSQTGKASIQEVIDEPVTIIGAEFLERFLTSTNQFLFKTVLDLVFVCDITTPEKFPAVLKVFVECVSRLEEVSVVKPSIYVLLHKTDLMPDPTQRAERMKFLMEMFQDAATAKNITFFQTSIYDNSIHEAFKRIIMEVGEIIPEAETIEKEEDLEAIQQRLRLRPIQQVLHTLKFMNRLDEVLLISLDDPTFRINASDANESEVQHLLTLLEKSNELQLPSGVQSEAKRLDSLMVYKSRLPPHHLLVLISSDPSAMLETRTLQEIEETVRLLSHKLESMLKTSI